MDAETQPRARAVMGAAISIKVTLMIRLIHAEPAIL